MKNGSIKKIAVFSDGRPGHEKQTAGIVRQLSSKFQVEITEVHVRKPSLLAHIYLLIRYIFYPALLVDRNLSGYHLLIGTGTHTHLPMLMHKKRLVIPVVTCMTPASYLRKDFDLIFSPQHDITPEAENIIKTIGPPNTNLDEKRHQDDHILILIGGLDPVSHTWSTSEVVDYIRKIVDLGEGKSYTISSSPRTPSDTLEALERFTLNRPNVVFFDYKNTPRGWVEKAYQDNKTVWVTADSISMVYEALSAGCDVGVIPVNWKKKTNKFKKSEESLRDSGLIMSADMFLAGKREKREKQSLNEAERCADIVIGRLKWTN